MNLAGRRNSRILIVVLLRSVMRDSIYATFADISPETCRAASRSTSDIFVTYGPGFRRALVQRPKRYRHGVDTGVSLIDFETQPDEVDGGVNCVSLQRGGISVDPHYTMNSVYRGFVETRRDDNGDGGEVGRQ